MTVFALESRYEDKVPKPVGDTELEEEMRLR